MTRKLPFNKTFFCNLCRTYNFGNVYSPLPYYKGWGRGYAEIEETQDLAISGVKRETRGGPGRKYSTKMCERN